MQTLAFFGAAFGIVFAGCLVQAVYKVLTEEK